MTTARRIPRAATAVLPALATVLAAVLAAGSVQAAEPWVGTWAASTHWCPPGRAGGAAPIQITPNGHQSGGNECVYADVSRVGEARWRVEAECVGTSGIPYHERFVFEMVGDNLEITYPDRGGVEVLQMRCR